MLPPRQSCQRAPYARDALCRTLSCKTDGSALCFLRTSKAACRRVRSCPRRSAIVTHASAPSSARRRGRPSAALVAELAAQQSAFPESAARQRALETLARPGTAAVLTGQQVGLFLGPLYTIYKAATAVVLAEALAVETGTPVVPIFWMATEDHDFAEVDHCTVARGSEAPLRLRVSADGRVDARAPVAEARLGADCHRRRRRGARRARRPPGRRRGRGAPRRAATTPGRRFGDAFGELLAALFADEGLLVFHPRTPAVAALVGAGLSHGARARRRHRRAAGRARRRARRRRLRRRRCTCAPTRRSSSPTTSAAAASSSALEEAAARAARRRRRIRCASPARRCCARSCRTRSSRRRRTSAARPSAATSAQSAAIYDLFDLPRSAGGAARTLPPRRRPHPRAARRARPRSPPTSSSRSRSCSRTSARAARRRSSRASCAPPSSTRRSTRSPSLPARIGDGDRQLGRAFNRTRATIERAVERLTARYARTLALARRRLRRRAAARARRPLSRRPAARARLRLSLVRRRRRAGARSSREYWPRSNRSILPCRTSIDDSRRRLSPSASPATTRSAAAASSPPRSASSWRAAATSVHFICAEPPARLNGLGDAEPDVPRGRAARLPALARGAISAGAGLADGRRRGQGAPRHLARALRAAARHQRLSGQADPRPAPRRASSRRCTAPTSRSSATIRRICRSRASRSSSPTA